MLFSGDLCIPIRRRCIILQSYHSAIPRVQDQPWISFYGVFQTSLFLVWRSHVLKFHAISHACWDFSCPDFELNVRFLACPDGHIAKVSLDDVRNGFSRSNSAAKSNSQRSFLLRTHVTTPKITSRVKEISLPWIVQIQADAITGSKIEWAYTACRLMSTRIE